MQNRDLETALSNAVAQGSLAQGSLAQVLRRIREDSSSLMRREASLELDRAALREDRAALRERERWLDRREAVLAEREAAPMQRGATLAGSRSQQPTGSMKADLVDDVPALVESYQTSGGIVPLGVLVAEVAALQQAASRLRTVGAAYGVQLQQLMERKQLDLTEGRRRWLEKILEKLQADKLATEVAETDLIERYSGLRDAGVERFTPLLLQTVSKYDAAFEGQMNQAGEGSLERIGALCEAVSAKGRTLRQRLPSALPCTSLATLMLMLDLAIQAGPNLLGLAQETAAAVGNEGVEVMMPPKPTKGLPRALQKTLEEYEGDYTRLVDYARITLVFEELSKLEGALAWLLATERAPRFVAVRTKDRLSRSWNAEMSGGNRDVMLNGWLDLGGGRRFIVEVQLHLRCLYALKSDLHVLYAGARVLGAMEDATASHQGKINGVVLERASRGVVRKVAVPFSPWDAAQREQLDRVLKQEPCALLELDMSYSTCPTSKDAHPFDGRTLTGLLQPETGTLACRRLQILRCGWNGIGGTLPSSIEHCRSLLELAIGNNQLTGEIPACLGTLKLLKILSLYQNKLSGPIPGALGELPSLEALALHDNLLSGQVPSAALARLTKLKDLQLGATREGGYTTKVPAKWQRYSRERGIFYCDSSGNSELWISAAGKAEILDAAACLKQSQDGADITDTERPDHHVSGHTTWWPKVVA